MHSNFSYVPMTERSPWSCSKSTVFEPHTDSAYRHEVSAVVDVIIYVVYMLWLFSPDFFDQCFNYLPSGSTEVTPLLSSAVLHLNLQKPRFFFKGILLKALNWWWLQYGDGEMAWKLFF